MVRSFAEHRAAPEAERRTAIVENAWILGPLFLFNNLHAAHHLRHRLPWYQIPKFYRLNRAALIERNGGLVYHGYLDVARRYLVKAARQPDSSRLGPAGGVSGEAPIASPADVRFPVDRSGQRRAMGVDRRSTHRGRRSRRRRRSPAGGDLATLWRDPGLVFGQTCGYPYVTELKERGHADRGAGICVSRLRRRFASKLHHPPRRRSASGAWRISRRDRCAQRWNSNTGMNLFRAAIAPVAGGAPSSRAIVVTGSHEASVAAVAEGSADLASIDCVSFALLSRGRPELIERVAVVAESPLSPVPAVHRQRAAWRLDHRRGARGAVRGPRRSRPRRSARDARSCGRAGRESGRLRSRDRDRARRSGGRLRPLGLITSPRCRRDRRPAIRLRGRAAARGSRPNAFRTGARRCGRIRTPPRRPRRHRGCPVRRPPRRSA